MAFQQGLTGSTRGYWRLERANGPMTHLHKCCFIAVPQPATIVDLTMAGSRLGQWLREHCATQWANGRQGIVCVDAKISDKWEFIRSIPSANPEGIVLLPESFHRAGWMSLSGDGIPAQVINWRDHYLFRVMGEYDARQ